MGGKSGSIKWDSPTNLLFYILNGGRDSPEELLHFIFNQRGFDSNSTINELETQNSKVERLERDLKSDPSNKKLQKAIESSKKRLAIVTSRQVDLNPQILKGKPLGHGSLTYAKLQLVDKNGNVIATGFGKNRGKFHAEDVALEEIELKLKHLKQQGLIDDIKLTGAHLDVAVDQVVCGRCSRRLTSFAKWHGLESIDVHHLKRKAATKQVVEEIIQKHALGVPETNKPNKKTKSKKEIKLKEITNVTPKTAATTLAQGRVLPPTTVDTYRLYIDETPKSTSQKQLQFQRTSKVNVVSSTIETNSVTDKSSKMTESKGVANNGTIPSTPTLRPSQNINKSKHKKIKHILQKINVENISRSVKFTLISGKRVVKNIGPGLVLGFIVGIVQDYFILKLFHWLTTDLADEVSKKQLIKISDNVEPIIHKKMVEAIKKHSFGLKYLPHNAGRYNVAVNSRLIMQWIPGEHYIPELMIIDNVIVGLFSPLITRKKEIEVSGNFTRTEGKIFPDDIYKVFECLSIVEVDYPDPGHPSLEGNWNMYSRPNTNNRQLTEKLTIKMSKDDSVIKITGIDLKGKKIQIYNINWARPNLSFRLPTKLLINTSAGSIIYEAYNEYHLTFKNWDKLQGTHSHYAYKDRGYSDYSPNPEYQELISLERSHYFDVLRHIKNEEFHFEEFPRYKNVPYK